MTLTTPCHIFKKFRKFLINSYLVLNKMSINNNHNISNIIEKNNRASRQISVAPTFSYSLKNVYAKNKV